MKVTVTWNPGDTWRKLGYLYYTNSSDYREVLAQNPQWSVTEEPPNGTVLALDVNQARQRAGGGNPGFFASDTSTSVEELIFPFDSQADYNAQVSKYSLYSLTNYNELNGYTMDTLVAQQGYI